MSYRLGLFSIFTFLLIELASMFSLTPSLAFAPAHASACTDLSSTTEIRLGSQVLHVPNTYLSNPRLRTTSSGLWIGLLLPDFLPASCNEEEFLEPGWHDQLTILLDLSHGLRPNTDQVKEMLQWGHVDEKNFKVASNGCREYQGNMTTAHELYACGHDDDLLVKCKAIIPVPFPSCSVFRKVDEQIIVVYTYSYQFIDKAQEIDHRVMEIISSLKKL